MDASEKSTNVRSDNGNGAARAPRAPLVVRASLGAMAAVASPVADRLAARWFLSPPRAPSGRPRPAGEPFALRLGADLIRGAQMGEGPAVVLAHGWGGHAAQLLPLAPALLSAGCSVVSFDGPAHGSSSGRVATIPLMAEAIAAVARRFDARAAIGHSFGGAALGVALHRGLELDAAVIIGAPSSPLSFFDAFCEALGLDAARRRGVRERLEAYVGLPMARFDARDLLRTVRTPGLVVHDVGDREVPFTEGEVIAGAWPGATLLRTEGLGHRRILRDSSVGDAVSRFVVERLSRCGCGRLAVGSAGGEPRCASCLLSMHLEDRSGRALRRAS